MTAGQPQPGQTHSERPRPASGCQQHTPIAWQTFMTYEGQKVINPNHTSPMSNPVSSFCSTILLLAPPAPLCAECPLSLPAAAAGGRGCAAGKAPGRLPCVLQMQQKYLILDSQMVEEAYTWSPLGFKPVTSETCEKNMSALFRRGYRE